jgi:hypothetical protein
VIFVLVLLILIVVDRYIQAGCRFVVRLAVLYFVCRAFSRVGFQFSTSPLLLISFYCSRVSCFLNFPSPGWGNSKMALCAIFKSHQHS